MTSVDTNILLFAQNADCAEHAAAEVFLRTLGARLATGGNHWVWPAADRR